MVLNVVASSDSRRNPLPVNGSVGAAGAAGEDEPPSGGRLRSVSGAGARSRGGSRASYRSEGGEEKIIVRGIEFALQAG